MDKVEASVLALLFGLLLSIFGYTMYVAGQTHKLDRIMKYCEKDGIYLSEGVLIRCQTNKSEVV